MVIMMICDVFYIDWDLIIVVMFFGYFVGMDNILRVSFLCFVLFKRDNFMMLVRIFIGMVIGVVFI